MTIATLAAWAISARAISPLNIGGRIVSYQPACTMAVPAPWCPLAAVPCPCLTCLCVSATCVPPPPIWSEIIFVPYGGTSANVCPPVAFPYFGGLPAPGLELLGWGASIFAPIQIGIGL